MEKFKKPIIFIGTGRSGTTIISEIINRHPHLAFPSNYQDMKPSNRKINLVRSLFDNSLWRVYGQKPQLNKMSIINKYTFRPSEAYNMWEYLTGAKLDFSRGFLTNETVSDERLNFIRSYFNDMVKYQNRKRLSVKVTGPSRIPFFLKLFPDAIFIHLKRDLVPTINSFLKVEFWNSRGAKQLWWQGVYNEEEKEWAMNNSNAPSLMTAFQLKKIIQITELELEQYKPKILETSYEDFVMSPKNELRRILSFAELPDMNLDEHLKKVKIFNRNKKHTDYFDKNQLEKIYQIINQ
ncbi:sulfotransferase [Winogradskyella aurantia]|uniref:Sulfotransferase family protein n=1 Tax=Winogradskyella aurantia TaxID=1915063 RepID=A0A265UT99_9FLAO|nr:sulfotransferase [Winogradskyella aurantia]OZV68534.1 hypothetical protein CA834_08655 [Winogradskyella aurantia]